MSNSLLHHIFGLKNQEYLKTEYKKGAVYFHIRTNEEHLKCGHCESFNVVKKGVTERILRTVPVGLKPVFLVAKVQRLECKECGLIRQERLNYADKKKAIPVNSSDLY